MTRSPAGAAAAAIPRLGQPRSRPVPRRRGSGGPRGGGPCRSAGECAGTPPRAGGPARGRRAAPDATIARSAARGTRQVPRPGRAGVAAPRRPRPTVAGPRPHLVAVHEEGLRVLLRQVVHGAVGRTEVHRPAAIASQPGLHHGWAPCWAVRKRFLACERAARRSRGGRAAGAGRARLAERTGSVIAPVKYSHV
jgi:hypothetical protein